MQEHQKQGHGGQYGRLVAMIVLSFIAMDIRKLCEGIIASQQSEIDQMKAKLSALDR